MKILTYCNRCAIALANIDPKLDKSSTLNVILVTYEVFKDLGVMLPLPLDPDQTVKSKDKINRN